MERLNKKTKLDYCLMPIMNTDSDDFAFIIEIV